MQSMGSISGAIAISLLLAGAAHGQANDVVCTQCVNSSDIADFAISNRKLQSDAVTSGKIAAGEVKTDDLADSSVTSAKVKDFSVINSKLKAGAVTEAKLGDGSVSSRAIAGGAVTLEKLDASARIVFAGSNANPIQFGTGTCQNAAQVTITVSGPGRIKVDAQVIVYVFEHTNLTTDLIWVFLGAAPDECIGNSFAEGYIGAKWTIGAAEPTLIDDRRNTLPVSRTFTVAEGGEYTYYLNAERLYGTGIAGTDGAAMQAVYFPGAD